MWGDIISKKIYVDFDGTIVNTVADIVSLYNEDFQYYKKFIPVKWWDVNTWDFTECNCATPEYINTYFNQQRFFDRLTYMDWAKEVLDELKETYDITIVSSGYSPNLKAKEIWISKNLPYCKFIGVNLKEYKEFTEYKSILETIVNLYKDKNTYQNLYNNKLKEISKTNFKNYEKIASEL